MREFRLRSVEGLQRIENIEDLESIDCLENVENLNRLRFEEFREPTVAPNSTKSIKLKRLDSVNLRKNGGFRKSTEFKEIPESGKSAVSRKFKSPEVENFEKFTLRAQKIYKSR